LINIQYEIIIKVAVTELTKKFLLSEYATKISREIFLEFFSFLFASRLSFSLFRERREEVRATCSRCNRT